MVAGRVAVRIASDPGVVSTGHLPLPQRVRELVHAAYAQFAGVSEGRNSTVYPALEAANPKHFGIALAAVDGAVYSIGDAAVPFAIMSVSKPFVFALVCEEIGTDEARDKLGVNSTGMPFNAITPVERNPDRRTNPMVNSGAIATTSLCPGGTASEKWTFIHAGLSRFAGRDLAVNDAVYVSASETNGRNQALARLLHSEDRLFFDPAEVVDLYTRQCSLDVTAADLATMGATLANGGVNPVTGERVVDPIVCRRTLAVMATAGLYETTGDWMYDVGLPGKSGIGGGIVTVAPGKGGLGTFAPPLDAAGNSVKGQHVAEYLAERLGLNVFASASSDAPRTEPGGIDR